MKTRLVNVIPITKIALSHAQIFTYTAPVTLPLSIGQLVKIPLGRRQGLGVVIEFPRQATVPYRLRSIEAGTDTEPYLTIAQLKLAQWIADYYVTSLGLVIKAMLPKISVRPPVYHPQPTRSAPKPKLTPAQQIALQTILEGRNPVTLLHGVTGSGKTEVYLRAIEQVIVAGRQCLVLIPEIALTPQTISRFTSRFPAGKIAVLHSRLPYGQRFREWLRIRAGEALIVIGSRSALFAPVKHLGLIVLDEEHESSYKQWDQQPRYHARETAIAYARLTGARVVLGSATPSVETYYAASQGKFNLASLPDRIVQPAMPRVRIVDLRKELQRGNRSIFSEMLQQRLGETLDKKRQAILFINRRGAATFVLCRDCGHVPRCPHCQISLTYHFAAQHHLLCHHCGFHSDVPLHCPHCQGSRIRYFGTGTQKVEAELKRVFPRARILRMDTDSTQRTHAHAQIFHAFAKHQADVLIGTQMVAKGFDLPKVDLVGIISADTSLHFPDFRANERTFQLLTQVAGRTGRGDKSGEVILQTYHPDHPVIRTAARHDYHAFYKTELAERRQLGYPPLASLTKITCRHRLQEKALQIATTIADRMKAKQKTVQVLGPVPAFVPKLHYQYIYLVFIQGAIDRNALRQTRIDGVVDVDPIDLLS